MRSFPVPSETGFAGFGAARQAMIHREDAYALAIFAVSNQLIGGSG